MAPANGWIYRRLKVRSREGFLVEQHGKQCMIRELFELPLAPFNSLGWATQAKLFVFRNLPVQCYIYIYCISIYLSIYLSILEDSGGESEGCGRIRGTRREGSNATLLCHERKVLLAESTEHKKTSTFILSSLDIWYAFSQGRGRSRIASFNSLYRGG